MKKLAVLFSAAILLFSAVCAGAEKPAEDLFDRLDGKLFEFSSGVGAWSTELTVGENGAFTGSFHDGEMGETGDAYPNGSVYGCSFHGQLTDPEPVDEYTWTAKITVEQDEGQIAEAIEDGIRYVTAAPYGLEKADTVTVFLPGTPVDRLPEGFLVWSHLAEIDPDASVIPYFALWSEADEAGFISSPAAGALEAMLNGAGNTLPSVTGEIADGCYFLTAQADGSGEWRADETAQEDAAAVLSASGVDNGVFYARYEPARDGEGTVTLHHFNAHAACDGILSFNLLVKDGKVQEVKGGSCQASPAEEELDPFISGEWLEKDTQFTALNAVRNPEGGWDVEFSSPVSHGAWVLRATAYYDCEYEAFVYTSGVKHDLLADGTIREQESETGLQGTLKFFGTEEDLQLRWSGIPQSEGEIIFQRAPVLPE